MKLFCISHKYQYELEKLLLLFFPLDKIEVFTSAEGKDGDYLFTEVSEIGKTLLLKAELCLDAIITKSEKEFTVSAEFNAERELALIAFSLLTAACGFTPQWGILTGVRPSKLMMSKQSELGTDGAFSYFTDVLRVSPHKAELAKSVALTEKEIIDSVAKNTFSLYVSIPFCPSRCSYCSFVSHSIGTPSANKLVPEYVDRLCDELKLTAKIAAECGLKLSTVYWGGGTPTTLSAAQLDRVLSVIEDNFDLSACTEYTVEAGRPDTVTAEKLGVLKKHKVDRISINPQTFSDTVLSAIGRKHTVRETEEKFALARSMGFDFINTDLIAGLPTDTPESFCRSVDRAIELGAENITVHTLAMKRSSEIVTEHGEGSLDRNITAEMVDYSRRALTKAGYKPYYMYRQSKSLGNLENVGWCKPGKECLYNIFMMEETQHIFSVGAGAVTKLIDFKNGSLERICNFKYPFEYNSRFGIMSERKKRINAFFSE